MTITSQELKKFAKSIGVDLIGITPAVPNQEAQKHLEDFLNENRHGAMHYLEDVYKRTHPQEILPNAQSVIVIAINYYRDVPEIPKTQGRFARYAYGRDYHKVIKNILKQLSTFILQSDPQAQCKLCVDSVPVTEKSYAVQAGLGFIGKNTTLITPEFGSYVLLGELLTTLEFEYDKPREGTCGTCTRCMEACPTKAIIAPHTMNATRCISYLTIENKGPIPEEFQPKMDNLIFGCDICQEVCPYNKAFAKPLQLKAFQEVKIAGQSMELQEILNIRSDEEFTRIFAGSPVMRTKRSGLQRNAKIALENALKSEQRN